MKLNLVDDVDDLKNRGDAVIYINPSLGKNWKQLSIVCPGCGKVSASAGKHKFNEVTKTYHPSIVHNKKLGGCGWHGWLKNGIFIKC